jgi:hypothetical protein
MVSAEKEKTNLNRDPVKDHFRQMPLEVSYVKHGYNPYYDQKQSLLQS